VWHSYGTFASLLFGSVLPAGARHKIGGLSLKQISDVKPVELASSERQQMVSKGIIPNEIGLVPAKALAPEHDEGNATLRPSRHADVG
jgi:hypothetical protein